MNVSKNTKIVGYAFAIVTALLMVSPVSAVLQEATTPSTTGKFEIYLQWADMTFDARNGAPAIPENLKISGFAPDELGTYIVQFNGPMDPSFRESLEALGALVYDDMYMYSVIARMTPQTMAKAQKLSTVAWIDIYQPAYKFPGDILETEGGARVTVKPFDTSTAGQLAERLSNMGVTVMGITESVEIYAPATMIPTIAHMNDVSSILRSSRYDTMDSVSNEIHRIDMAHYTSWSGLPYSLTGTGAADTYIIGIQDTGLDIYHADFTRPTSRIRDYQDKTGTSDPDGHLAAQGGVSHGTHCAGIAVGNGYSWEMWQGQPINDAVWHLGMPGAAPQAQTIVYGCTAVDQHGNYAGLAVDITYWDEMQTTDASTKTYSGSFGSGPGEYDNTWSQGHDERANTDNTRLFVMAAGNDGPDLDTMNAGSQAKNGLSVGANKNYRPEWFDADNPNLLADFSSRGGTFSNGRIKPDIVATGTSVISTLGVGEWDAEAYNPNYYGPPPNRWDNNNNEVAKGAYQYMSGTSMACPYAAGASVLVREYYREVQGLTEAQATSQLIKATMINGADRMSELYDYPGYDQGWGRVNLQNALFPATPRSNQFKTGTISTAGTDWNLAWDGATNGINMEVYSDDTPLKVTLTWIDTSGRALNRNLDLRLMAPDGTIYKGNAYPTDRADPYYGYTVPNGNVRALWAGTDSYDNDNNVEQVEVKNPMPGTWQLRILGRNIPSATNFAVIFSANVGPTKTYQVDVTTDYPTTFSVAQNGQVSFPFKVRNWGTANDNIAITENEPTGLTFSYNPTSPLAINAGQVQDVTAIVSASGTITPGAYTFQITGTSQNDPGTPKAAGTLSITVEVLNEPLPAKMLIADLADDETDPSVVTFNDGTNNRIVVVYKKTALVGEARLWVKNAVLDANGNPGTWSSPVEIGDGTDPYLYPKDARIYHMPSGTFANRVFIVWTGYHANYPDNNYEMASSGWIAYADLVSTYSTWTTVLIDRNTYSSGTSGYKRVNYLAMRPGANEIFYAFEHLDYDGTAATGVDAHFRTSTNGGDGWSAAAAITPGDGNFYFFPYGITDQNGVIWNFFYWRTPTGNDRDLRVRLYDGAQSVMLDVWDTTDNIQFPSAVSTAEGTAGNRVYVAMIRDGGSSDKLWTTYIDGDYTSAAPPATSTTGWGNTKGAFGGTVGSSNYDRRPVVPIAATNDGWVWLPYEELDNPYGTPNYWALRSNDMFTTTTTTRVTADAYAKGHQMLSTLTIGTYSYIYMVYHSNKGTSTDVNYDIYLTKFRVGALTDDMGPTTSGVAANPNPYNVSSDTSFSLTANINDMESGGSDINAAEYMFHQLDTEPAWTGTANMALSGAASPSRVASATVTPTGWVKDSSYRYWVRGRDSANNWGAGAYVDVLTIGDDVVVDQPPYAPSNPSPANGAIGVSQDPTLSATVTCPQGETMTVSFYDAAGPTLLNTQNNVPSGTSPTYQWTGLALSTTYNWYVTAQNSVGTTQGPTWSFTTTSGPQAPDAPILVQPTNGETEVILDPTLEVQVTHVYGDPIDEVRFYDSPGNTLLGTVYNVASGGYASIVWSGRTELTTYNWYAVAQNTVGSTQSATWSFTTGYFSPPPPPTGLTVEHWGPSGAGSTLTETRYMRGVVDEAATGNFLLGTTQSATAQTTGNLGNRVHTYAGIRVWKVSDGGVETEITSGTAVALAERTANGAGLSTGLWTPPLTALLTTDSIRVRVYVDTAAGPTTLRATFMTEALGAAQLDSVQWSVSYYLTRANPSFWGWGDATYNTNIANFQYTTPTLNPYDHNTLNWTHDGTGGIEQFNIYRSDLEAGPYSFVASVPAGTYTYCDLDRGQADSILWWYVVRADNAYGEETNENAVQEPGLNVYTIDLSGKPVGWVFVSFPVDVSGDIGTILDDSVYGGGGTTWDVAKWYDGLTKTWKTYRTGYTPTFTTIDNTMGVWLHLTANDGNLTLSATGSYPTASVNITLYAGWNMVSYPSATNRAASVTLPAQADIVSVWQATSPYVSDQDPAAVTMSHGNAYWVHVTADCLWTVDP